MTDFIISEERLEDIRGMIFHEDEIKFEKLSWKIISRPLSEELKKERERVKDMLKITCFYQATWDNIEEAFENLKRGKPCHE